MGFLHFPRRSAKRKQQPPSVRSLRMEQLEDRRMLAVNLVPHAVNDEAVTTGNVPVFVHLVANDYDRDGTVDPASILITSGPRAGTVDVRSDGVIKYTPPKNRFGTDSLAYSVVDNLGATSNSAAVSVLVRSAHQNPDMHFDVNDDGRFSPIDVLQIIKELNMNGSHMLTHPPTPVEAPPPYLDVTGDGYVTPADPKKLIECLNEYSRNLDSSSLACQFEPPLPMYDPSETDSPSPDDIPSEVPPEFTDNTDTDNTDTDNTDTDNTDTDNTNADSSTEADPDSQDDGNSSSTDSDDVLSHDEDELPSAGSLTASGSGDKTDDPLGDDPLGDDPLGDDPLGDDPLGDDPLENPLLTDDPFGLSDLT